MVWRQPGDGQRAHRKGSGLSVIGAATGTVMATLSLLSFFDLPVYKPR
jgi:hypothetical protein